MCEEKKMPIMDDFLKALESRNETEMANQIRQSMIASKLLNPLLDVSIPIEMKENMEFVEKPYIS